ncbi:MAG TPA: hypothetical protein VKA37_01470 [Halobacteriales archaeon]|nr:hypothetical protein [Halobacteriales archaeon]
MVVLAALRSALAGLARNPVLFAVAGVMALFQLPQLAAQALEPLLASALSLVFSLASIVVVPFFQAGFIGMADEAIDGHTRAGRFLAAGREHFVSMLIAYVLLFAVLFVFWIVALVGGFVFFAFALGVDGPGLSNPAVVATGVLLAAAVALVYLGTLFFVQFYGQAIVIDGRSPVDGFRRSVGLVRRNVVPTLGYSVLAGLLGATFGGAVAVASLFLSPRQAEVLALPALSPGAAVAVGVVVVSALVSGFLLTFSVAFYRAIVANEGESGAAQAAD